MTFYSRNLSWNKAQVFKPNKVGLAFGYFATHNNISAVLHIYFQFERRFHTFYTQNVNVVKSPFLDKWKYNWIFPTCDFEEKNQFQKVPFSVIQTIKISIIRENAYQKIWLCYLLGKIREKMPLHHSYNSYFTLSWYIF